MTMMVGEKIQTSPYRLLGQWAFKIVITVEVQTHGYRKGHQLLGSSVTLSKDDQAVVDRFSDVAGPLSPREEFAPYLSAYPLPSGIYYVLARTWQDPTVSRAGCVRTKSVLINAQLWSQTPPLIPVIHLLDSTELPTELDAVSTELEVNHEERLPPAKNFGAGELLEALFLEEARPVVVFEAPNPELIALRLLSALWPNIRSRFTLSTFALSPRKIGGRDLDLIFAPLHAKAKFANWSGRRMNGRATQPDRHRWTASIVRRVFEEAEPHLLSNQHLALLGEHDANNTAALRIVLLWDELLNKLDRNPSAVLGLLDIANSGRVSNTEALKSLEPRLADVARRAVESLSLDEAWDFLVAMARKTEAQNIPTGRVAIEQLATHLAELEPDGAVALLRKYNAQKSIASLIPCIAVGLGTGAAPDVEEALWAAPSDVIARLVSQGGELTRRVSEDERLISRMGAVLIEAERETADKAGIMLLPFLVEDRHFKAAMPIFGRLDSQGVAAELRWLGEANNFKSKRLSAALVNQAREVGGLSALRDVLTSFSTSAQRDALLELTIEPIAADVLWLLEESCLSEATTSGLLASVLRRSDDERLAALLADPMAGVFVVANLPDEATDILIRAALKDSLPINAYISVIQFVMKKVDDKFKKLEVSEYAMGRCLSIRFDGDEIAVLSMLMAAVGEQLDVQWMIKTGLKRGLDADVMSRNMIAFEGSPSNVRQRIVAVVDKVIWALQGSQVLQLNEDACDACARLIFDAERVYRGALSNSAGRLMPSLFKARHRPVSLIIAALFPVVYRELAQTQAVPEILKLFPSFFEWDRCKPARHELVEAFLSSSWAPAHLALTAYRCGDTKKILKRVIKSDGGEEYLARIEKDLNSLGEDTQNLVSRVINEIRSTRS